MELQFKGGNCLKLVTKKASVVIDDNLKDLGQKPVAGKGEIVLFTNQLLKSDVPGAEMIIDGPGEYEVKGISITGIEAQAHMDEAGKRTATIYRITVGSTTVVVTGHIYPELSEEQLEAIGLTDILVVPVGGNGYTLDADGAAGVIKKISPKAVVPTHYADKDLKYEVPQNSLEDFMTHMAATAEEPVDKLKFKGGDLPETFTVFNLTKS